ncbi:unnamed protein product [Larinioides sclopetarius]|uniref:Uncharacterized protein n=1 Tax=Larinioides sclopetarius TaxID=280406 RepID=A0AAV2BGX9_9ARAC
MASGHKINFNDNPDSSHSCTMESSNNLNDRSRSMSEGNLLGSFSGNKVSQPLFHQYLHSSSHRPSEMNLIRFNVPQPTGILNVPKGFYPLHHHSSENVSSMAREMKTFSGPQHKIPFCSNEYLAPHIPSGTEFSVRRNRESFRQDLRVQQSSEKDGSHPPTIQSPDNVPRMNPQLLSKRHNFTEYRCNTIQETDTKNVMGGNEISATQGSYAASQQFVELNMNRFQRFDLLEQQQSGNKPNAPQNSYPLSHKPQQRTSNIGQKESSISRKVFENECRSSQCPNLPTYFPDSGESNRIQDLPLQSSQHSGCRSREIQSLLPHQLESQFNWKLGIDPKHYCALYYPNRVIPNESVTSQNLHSLSQQLVESETHKIQDQNPLPKAFIKINPNKRQTPHSRSQQRLKRKSCAIPHAKIKSNMSDTYPLPGNSSGTDHVISRKEISSDKAPDNVIGVESIDLRMLQHLYSNRSELINILVFGPEDCSRSLLQTSAGRIPLRFAWPYCFAFQRDITRSGILMKVAVWEIHALIESINFLKYSCLFTKHTIILALNARDRPKLLLTLRSVTSLIRRDISCSAPIILVGCKVSMGTSDNVLDSENSFALTNMGFRLKAKYDLSAFLECSVDSTEEVETVILTALDVSFLCK